MADQTKVEKFRLTKDQVAFQRAYKKMLGVGQVVQGKILQNINQGQSLQEMLRRVSQGLNQMQMQAPQNPVHELEGQGPANVPVTGPRG